MEMKLALFMVASLILCGQSAAQTPSAIETYDRGTIYLYHSFFDSGFVKNSQVMSLGMFGSNLEAQMAGS